MKVSEKLKLLRSEKRYSQSQVAKELFVSFQAISNWETGKTYPDISNLIKLSDFYNVSLDELIKEDEELKRNLESKSKNWKLIYHTLIIAFGIFLLIGIVYIYLIKKNFLWFPFVVSLFLIIDGIILLRKSM